MNVPTTGVGYLYEDIEFHHEKIGFFDKILETLPSTEFTLIVCFFLILFVLFVDDYSFLNLFFGQKIEE